MDSDMFSTTIEDGSIALRTAADVVRFSFIVQDSISNLDLIVSKSSAYFRSLCDSCRSRRSKYFVNTEEKCRKFFAPRRRLLYTLHLDLPNGRECSLKDDVPESIGPWVCYSPHIAEICLTCGFRFNILSNLVEEAFSNNIPKEKILKWLVKFNFSKEMPMLYCLEIRTASKFLDCFYPEVTDSALLCDFIKQFDIVSWMAEHEQPEILEYLLYHTRLLGNISLENEFGIELINHCIFSTHYLNIGPLLKYLSYSKPTYSNYEDYFFKLAAERPSLTEEVMDKVSTSKTVERICLMMQIIYVFKDIQSHHRIQFCHHYEDASEALRLIWSSIPDECITFRELEDIFGAAFSEEELVKVCNFYFKAIGEFHAFVEPRPLKHLCRTVLRKTFEENNLWIPDAIRRTGLPKSLQSFLNLEKSFAV